MEIYQEKKARFISKVTAINKKYNSISILRLIAIALFVVSSYYYIQNSEVVFLVVAVCLFITFIVLMRFHTTLAFKRKLHQSLVTINENEIAYLKRDKIPFEDGLEFIDFQHPYAYDLDIFGEHSLFQNCNRTATYVGKKRLANQLLTLLSKDQIIDNQQAIKELSEKLDWRQEFLAYAKVGNDNRSNFETLLKWTTFNSIPLSKSSVYISYVSPMLFLGFVIAYIVSSNLVYASILSYLFVINLIILGRFIKRIQCEIANSTAIDKTIHQYSLLLQKIEYESFKSEKLVALQKKLKFKKENASIHLKHLADLFSRMDSISNFVTAIVFNGTFLFNLHVLKSLIQWKNDHAEVLEEWLNVIGEFEMLNSLANMSYNNPDFVFPTLNENFEVDFTDLSHPLLNPKSRIGNNVHFQPQSFMILTGSNMSGKSTFLRSLGINMVLSGIGSPVCASQANVHPLPVLVSMRLSDSLSDSESYFFAEIKRLKQIMDELENRPAFVLLDEILRGTNSDDKRNGTIEVVKKVIAKKAIGAIATHDIEVCLTTNEYPNILTNKCFEVEIVDNELHFDYKLHDGICKNRSATFLMKKMGVI
ncbi:MutS-related protein [Flavobacterium sp. ZT3P35]|uniref:MutS-related protein n=1 Tax=unclassified Flavobacterium TaxID=196869 RepID=UPI003AAA3D1C